MRRLFYILAFLPFAINVKADHDSLYCIAVDQLYAIPEDVSNGDYVGDWLKNLTYMSSFFTYTIESNWNNAFAISEISEDTARLTINDYTKINGKIVQQDTVVKILIRTTDNTYSTYEIDTAFIRIKENSWCAFNIDNDSLSYYEDHEGYGLFWERGTILTDITQSWQSHIADSVNPTIFGAYGQGNRPIFDGEFILNVPFWFGDVTFYEYPYTDRCEYIWFFDGEWKNYNQYFASKHHTREIRFYNSYFHNLDYNDTESMFKINSDMDDDSLTNARFVWQNCRLDSSGMGEPGAGAHNLIKCGSGPAEVINCYFGYINVDGIPLRFTAGRNSLAKHNLFDCGSVFALMQVRADSTNVIDNRFLNSQADEGMIIITESCNEEYCYGTPADSVVVRNNKTINCEFDYIIKIIRSGTEYNPSDDIYIQDNDFSGAGIGGIGGNNGRNVVIERNLLHDNFRGIYFTSMQYVWIYNNIIYGATPPYSEVYLAAGDSAKLLNNTVDGDITVSSVDTCATWDNFYGIIDDDDDNANLDIDDYNDYFTNYAEHDYSLLSTAEDAIDDAVNDIVTEDYFKNPIYNGIRDIGAYEYTEAEEFIEQSVFLKGQARSIFLKTISQKTYLK